MRQRAGKTKWSVVADRDQHVAPVSHHQVDDLR